MKENYKNVKNVEAKNVDKNDKYQCMGYKQPRFRQIQLEIPGKICRQQAGILPVQT